MLLQSNNMQHKQLSIRLSKEFQFKDKLLNKFQLIKPTPIMNKEKEKSKELNIFQTLLLKKLRKILKLSNE